MNHRDDRFGSRQPPSRLRPRVLESVRHEFERQPWWRRAFSFKLNPIFTYAVLLVVLATGVKIFLPQGENVPQVAVREVPPPKIALPKVQVPTRESQDEITDLSRPEHREIVYYAGTILLMDLLIDFDVLQKWTPKKTASQNHALFWLLPMARASDSNRDDPATRAAISRINPEWDVLSEHEYRKEVKNLRLHRARISKQRRREYVVLFRAFRKLPKKTRVAIMRKYPTWRVLSAHTKSLLWKRYQQWLRLKPQQRAAIRSKFKKWRLLSEQRKVQARARVREAS